jgi:hypothetical protein
MTTVASRTILLLIELVKVVNCELGTFDADEFVSIEFELEGCEVVDEF